jgi:hypothetical protein
MAKVSQQLGQSLRIYLSVTVTVLLPWLPINKTLAGGELPTVAHHRMGSSYPTSANGNFDYHGDISCEPSFRGGECQDCCLDLWQGYCESRICASGCSRLQYGVGCLGLGCLHNMKMRVLGGGMCHGHCGTGNCSSCSSGTSASGSCSSGNCHCSSGVSDNELIEYETQETNAIAPPVVPAEVPRAVAPPENPLPSSVPPAPSSATHHPAAKPVQPTPPIPPQIDFSAEPPSPGRTPVTTVSGSRNPGTIRLLEQLRTN